MNVRNQSDVAYQTSGVEERSKPTGSRQFKGKNMPQGNTMEKKKSKSVSKKEVSKMIKKSEKKDDKKDKKMIKKAMPKKKGMSMVSDKRIEEYGKKGRRYE